MRYAFVARERTRYPLRLLCRLLAVSVSGFHDWLHRHGRPDLEAALTEVTGAYAAEADAHAAIANYILIPPRRPRPSLGAFAVTRVVLCPGQTGDGKKRPGVTH